MPSLALTQGSDPKNRQGPVGLKKVCAVQGGWLPAAPCATVFLLVRLLLNSTSLFLLPSVHNTTSAQGAVRERGDQP